MTVRVPPETTVAARTGALTTLAVVLSDLVAVVDASTGTALRLGAASALLSLLVSAATSALRPAPKRRKTR